MSPGSFGLRDGPDPLLGHGVDGLSRLIDLHVEGECLDGKVDHDGEQGGEQRAEHVVLTTVLAHLNHLGDDETDNVHPCDGAGERETSHDRVQGLRLQLEGNA